MIYLSKIVIILIIIFGLFFTSNAGNNDIPLNPTSMVDFVENKVIPINPPSKEDDRAIFIKIWAEKADSIKIAVEMENFASAIEIGVRCVNDYKKNNDQYLDSNYISIINYLANAYYYIGKKDTALEYAKYDSSLSLKLYGENGRHYIESINRLAMYYWEVNQLDMVEFLFEKSLQISEMALNKDDDLYIRVIDNLAKFYLNYGNLKKSELYFKKEAEELKKTGKMNSIDYGFALNFIGRIYYTLSKLLEAEPYFEEAIKIFKEQTQDARHKTHDTNNLITKAAIIHNLALLYTDLGRYSEAEKNFKESIQIRKNMLGETDPDYAQSLNAMGMLYYNTGRFNESEKYYKTAQKIIKEKFGDNHITYAIYSNNLALLCNDMGRNEEAEKLYKKSCNIILKNLGEEHPYYAQSLNNLGYLYENTYRLNEADSLFRIAISLKKKILGENNSDYAKSLNNLAFLDLKSGKFEEAEALFKECIEIDKIALSENHPSYATDLNNLAILYFYQKKYKESINLLNSANEIRQRTLNENHPDLAQSLQNLALLYSETGKPDSAEFYFDSALKKYLNRTKKIFTALSDKEKEQFYGKIKNNLMDYYSFAIDFAQKKPEISAKLYDYQIATKAMLLKANQKMRNNILSRGDSLTVEKFKKWLGLKAYLSGLYNKSTEELKNLGINLDSLEIESNDIEKELSKLSSFFAKEIDKKEKSWKNIQEKLKDDEAAIEIIRINKFGWFKLNANSNLIVPGLTDKINYAFLIIKKNIQYPELVLLEDGNTLDNISMKEYGNLIQSQRTGNAMQVIIEKKSGLIYEQIWRKIQLKLNGINKVYLSLDGSFNFINLNTLFDNNSGRYLIDVIDLRLVTNTSDILEISQSLTESQTLTYNSASLFGYPKFLLDSSSIPKDENDIMRSKRFETIDKITQNGISPLPGTKTEIEGISNILKRNKWEVLEYLGEQCTESSVKSTRNPYILHFATHGLFLNDKNEGEKITGIDEKKYGTNPLLNSMLLFSGAENSIKNIHSLNKISITDDGLLTAYEAMNLNLDNTELVVLSACETGLGEIKNGEGVYGLQRAFQVAGAKSLIMSLWSVSDNATQELMTSFYDKWLSGKTKREAFREAQLELKKKYPGFYYWGAFVMVGE